VPAGDIRGGVLANVELLHVAPRDPEPHGVLYTAAMHLDLVQAVTLAIALVGALLGFLNTWRTFSQDRVRLRVRSHYNLFTNGEERLGVTVVNLSTFAVTIAHIGLTMRSTENRLHFIDPMLSNGDKLPHRLEPRASFTAFPAAGAHKGKGMDRAHRAFVTTQCGVEVLGSAKHLATALHNLSLASGRN
jgi:hypothetical protein